MLHVACGNRRETVCPACSAVYKRDARQLVRAGLAGGKGVPETITGHPCVFATLTAPSFGPVHSRRMRGKTVLPCRPRRDTHARRCPHGRDISCPTRHVEDDPRLGQPMCGDCYDYEAAVLFNAHAGALWRRFTTYLPRHLARLAGVTQKALRTVLRIRYVKVGEYQARGVVHFHAVIRLDAPGQDYQPPPAPYTADLLCDAIRQATAAISSDRHYRPGSPAIRLTFGAPQGTDARPIRHGGDLPGTGQALSAPAVANYIAKYATKTLTVPGVPDKRIRTAFDLHSLRCSAHYQRMITTAWRLGHRTATGDPRFRQMGAHARLRRPLPHQIPPLLRHLRPAPRGPHRAPPCSSATPAANATPGAAPSTNPSSLSLRPGPMPEPATPPPPALSWPPHPPLVPASTTARPTLPHDPASTVTSYLLDRPEEKRCKHEIRLRPPADLEEAAEILNTKPRFVRRLIEERRIRFTRVGRHVAHPRIGRTRIH